LLVTLLLTGLWAPALAAQPPAKPLTTAQQKRLQERDRLWAEANRLNAQGRSKEALAVLDKVLAIERAVLGNTHEDLLGSLQLQARIHTAREAWPDARKSLQEVADIRRKVFGADNWRTTDAKLDLTGLNTLSKLDRAQRRRVAEAYKLDDRATELGQQGKYKEAAALYRRALQTYQELVGNNHRDTLRLLTNLGHMLVAQGDYAKARQHNEKALAVLRKVVGDRHPLTGEVLRSLGAGSLKQGNLVAARNHFEQALAVFKKADHPAGIVKALANLANVLFAQDDYDAARLYLEQALALARKGSGDNRALVGDTLNNLAAVLVRQGEFEAARGYAEEAYAIRKKIYGVAHPELVPTLNNLGHLRARQWLHQAKTAEQKQEAFKQAKYCYEQALAICRKVHGEEHPDTANAYQNLGVFYALTDVRNALDPYAKALAIQRKVLGNRHRDTVLTIYLRAEVLRLLGKHPEARPLYEEALEATLANLALFAASQSERQQLAMSEHSRAQLDGYLSLNARAQGTAEKTFGYVLVAKGAIWQRQRDLRLLRSRADLAPLLADLQATSAKLANLAFAVPGEAEADSWKQRIADLTHEKERLERELASKNPAYRQEKAVARLTPDALKKQLPPGTVLIDFLEYFYSDDDSAGPGRQRSEQRLTAFVVRAGRPVARVELGATDRIEKAIDTWRLQINQSEPKAGQELRRLLWEPLEPFTRGATEVLLSPDGALNKLPFAALPAREPGKFLLEETPLATVPVPRLLVPLLTAKAAGSTKTPSLLLVGDVDFAAATGKPAAGAGSPSVPRAGGLLPPWERLAGTRAEVAALHEAFVKRFPTGSVQDLRGADATEAAVRVQGPRHRVLHLATHGFFAPSQVKSALGRAAGDGKKPAPAAPDLFGSSGVSGFHPGLLSGLVLAGANHPPAPGKDDGILTALEVAELDLERVELVVLSACETGLGQTAGGEGVLGLQRSFQVAGARTVVSSLWSVPDEPTKILMERFYANLWDRKMSKLEALREAQIWMLRQGRNHAGVQRGLRRVDSRPAPVADGRLPPFYWAAFVLSGDWR
jgi:CHAT domain-containing protein